MRLNDQLAQQGVEALHHLVPGARLVRYRSGHGVQVLTVVLPGDVNLRLEIIRNFQLAVYVVEHRRWFANATTESAACPAAMGGAQLSLRFGEQVG